ncbi:hypothetical protein BH11CYA1_BH11CYA1_42900 [soil metagenome]
MNKLNNLDSQETAKHKEQKAGLNERFQWLYCALVYGLALAAIFAEKIFQGVIFAAEDGRVQNYPAFASPGFFWTPLLLTGFPVLADPQTCMFYPLCFISKHLLAGYQGWNLYLLSAYFLSAMFAALFAFRLTKSHLAAMVAGLVYGFGGYLISELRHVQIIQTAVWLPLLLYFVESLKQRSKWTILQVVLMAAASALTILAGHPQTATYIFAATGVYAAFAIFSSEENSKSRKFKQTLIVTSLTTAAIISGAALAAVQLLPSYELSQESVRSTFGYKDFLVGQLEPMQILGFGMPYMLGGQFGSLDGMPFSEQGPPPGLLFFGYAPLILAIFAALKLRAQPVVPYLIVTCILSALFALGGNTPLGPLFHTIPVMGSFRGLYRILLLPTLAISILAALGIAKMEGDKIASDKMQGDKIHGEAPTSNLSFKQEALTNWQKLGKWKHIALCLYVLISALVPTFLFGTLPIILFKSRPEILWRKGLLLVSIFAVIASYAVNSQWFKASVNFAQFNPPSDCAQLQDQLKEKNQRIFSLRGLEGEAGEYPPNLSRLWAVSNASGYEPLMPRRYMQLLGIAEGGFLQPPWRIKAQDRSFDICAVRFLLAPADAFGGRAFVDDAWQYWKLVSQSGGVLRYENSRARPRFYLVPEHRDVSAQQALVAIKTSALPNGELFDPETMVLLESQTKSESQTKIESETRAESEKAPSKNSETKLDSISAVTVEALADEKIELATEADFSGYLVAADQYYPGWQATLDGQKVPICRANYVQRAVKLTAGKHKVVFSYQPESYRLGALISSIALAILALAAIIGTAIAFKKN